jgi:outer membrane protein
MYKKFISILVTLSFLAFSNSFAEEKFNIGVIDLNKVFAESKAGKSIEDALKKKRDSEEANFKKTQESLVKDGEDLKKQQGVLAVDAFEKKRKVHEGKVAEFQLAIQKSQNSFETARNNSLNAVHDKIMQITKDISKKQSLKLVLLKAVAFYSEDSLDITSEVVKLLDKEMSKVEVKF